MIECTHRLAGMNVLVVEDEYLIATHLCQDLSGRGLAPIGPFASIGRALQEVDSERRVDAAILDININGEPVFPVAERLIMAGIPFLFATGYDDWSIPDTFFAIQRLEKPLDTEAVIASLGAFNVRRMESAGGAKLRISPPVQLRSAE